MGFVAFFSASLFEILITDVKENVLKYYFCSRTDSSYNISVEFKDDEILVLDKYGLHETHKYDDFIKELESCTKHRLLDSVLEKIKAKTTFNFAVNEKLNICGLYGNNFTFTEAYAYLGEIRNLNILSILTSPSLGWLKPGEQDEDLVYSLIYLLVEGYYNNQYCLLFYNNFIIFKNFRNIAVFRLDIDYKKIFGIVLKDKKNSYIFQMSLALSSLFIKDVGNTVTIHNITSTYEKFNNKIAQKLKKKYNGDVKKCLHLEDFKSIKKYLDVNKIKENKEFMEILDDLKSNPTVIKLIPPN